MNISDFLRKSVVTINYVFKMYRKKFLSDNTKDNESIFALCGEELYAGFAIYHLCRVGADSLTWARPGSSGLDNRVGGFEVFEGCLFF